MILIDNQKRKLLLWVDIGDGEKVKSLLRTGLSVNATDNYDDTALIASAANGHTSIRELFTLFLSFFQLFLSPSHITTVIEI